MLRRLRITRGVTLLAVATIVIAATLAVYGLVTWSAPSSREVSTMAPSDGSPLAKDPGKPGLQSEGDGTKTRSSRETDADDDKSLPDERQVVVDFSRFRQLLPKDAIRPIYEPEFAPGELTSLHPGELVIGVEINGESKAYPVGPLNRREMVNDVVGGVPVLVSW